jgi:hypothetical protein
MGLRGPKPGTPVNGGKGRPKGRPNGIKHLTMEERKALAAQYDGLTPLGFLMSVMRYEGNPPNVRFAAAKELMPYLHRKMPTAAEHTFLGPDGQPVVNPVGTGIPTLNIIFSDEGPKVAQDKAFVETAKPVDEPSPPLGRPLGKRNSKPPQGKPTSAKGRAAQAAANIAAGRKPRVPPRPAKSKVTP